MFWVSPFGYEERAATDAAITMKLPLNMSLSTKRYGLRSTAALSLPSM
jgi:hypothetical protein